MVEESKGLSRGLAIRALSAVSFGVFVWRSTVHAINMDIRDASHKTPNLLTPADEFFSIWGLIDISLAVFVVRELWRPSHALSNTYILHLFFIASCPCATSWMELFVAGYTKFSFVPIFALWLLLFSAYLYVENNIEPIVVTSLLASTNANHQYQSTSRLDFWTIRTPFTLFWAWTCAAATISLNILIEEYGIHDMTIYIFWSGMWVLANSVILVGTGDIIFAFVAEWTLIGIAIKNNRQRTALINTSTIPDTKSMILYGEYYALEAMASVGASVFGALFCFLVIHKYWRGPRTNKFSLIGSSPIPPTYGTNSI